MSDYTFTDILADSMVTIEGTSFKSKKVHDEKATATCTSLFFPGCSFINFAQPIVEELFDILTEKGLVDGISLMCCGKILAFEEHAETVKPVFQSQLARSIRDHGVKRIVTACPNCVAELRAILAEQEETDAVEVVVLSKLLVDAGFSLSHEAFKDILSQDWQKTMPEGANPCVTIHDSCPDRATGEFADSVRAMFPSDVLVEKEHNRARSFCCGSLSRAAGRPDVMLRQAAQHGEEGKAVEAQAIITYCMSCANILGTKQDALPVHHYLEFLVVHHIDWAHAPDYMEIRFLFSEMHGTRRYFGASGTDSE